MYEIIIRDIKFGVSFSFFALLSIVCFWQSEVKMSILICLFCCAVHEAGHFVCMLITRCPVKSCILYGGGILINGQYGKMNSNRTEIFCLLGGIMANIVLCVCCKAFGFSDMLFAYSLFCCVFNLLPLKYFDGGQILDIITNSSVVAVILRYLILISFAGVIILMAVGDRVNVSLVVTFGYLAVSEIFL